MGTADAAMPVPDVIGQHPVIVAIIAAVAAVLGPWGVVVLNRWADGFALRKDRRRTLLGMEALRETCLLAKQIRMQSSASRVLLLVGHNSGGFPRPGAPFYVSVVFPEIDDKQSQSIQAVEGYHEITVDAAYIAMLLRAEAEGMFEMAVHADMPECQLRSYYEAEGIHHTVIVFLGIKDKQFHFMSVAKHKDEPFTKRDLVVIEIKAQAMRRFYR